MSVYLPLILDTSRGVYRRLKPGDGLSVPGSLAVTGGPGFFGAEPLEAQVPITGSWGQSLTDVLAALVEAGLLQDGRAAGWADSLAAAVALSSVGPYKVGRLIIGSGTGWKALDQPLPVSGVLQALVARSGSPEEEAPGVQAQALGYAPVVGYNVEPAQPVVGTLWFSSDIQNGAQVRSSSGWVRLESFLRGATTAASGLVQLADAAAIAAGTAGRVVDAAQLKAAAPAAATTTASGLVQLADAAAIAAGTAGRVVDAAQLKNPIVASLNNGPIAGARNRIINGGMAVDQRNNGTGQNIVSGAALTYTVDRFYAYCSGANVVGQRVPGASAGLFRYRFSGAAGVTAISFGQRIEQLNSADLAGTTVTLSVDLANSLLTAVTWTLFYANTADSFGALASPTRTQFATGTFTVSSSIARYSAQVVIPAAASTGIEVVFTVGAQISGTWTIGDVQLEPGGAATPFERRSHGQELALCQRYFEQSYNDGVAPGTVTSNGQQAQPTFGDAGGAHTFTTNFRVPKRTAPTVTIYSPNTGGAGFAYAYAGSYINSVAVLNMSVQPYGVQVTTHAYAVSAGSARVLHYVANAEL